MIGLFYFIFAFTTYALITSKMEYKRDLKNREQGIKRMSSIMYHKLLVRERLYELSKNHKPFENDDIDSLTEALNRKQYKNKPLNIINDLEG